MLAALRSCCCYVWRLLAGWLTGWLQLPASVSLYTSPVPVSVAPSSAAAVARNSVCDLLASAVAASCLAEKNSAALVECSWISMLCAKPSPVGVSRDSGRQLETGSARAPAEPLQRDRRARTASQPRSAHRPARRRWPRRRSA
jgi:hypothetical protein